MKTYKSGQNSILEAEMICLRLKAAINALKAVHIAMIEGPDAPEEYGDGLFCICTLLDEETERLNKVIDDTIHRKEEKASV